MDIFNLIMLAGGLAFFLYGMHVMSTGLEKIAGGKLGEALKKMTSNAFKSVALGAGITIAIQSSSAVTVMLVGLVNSGIMTLNQTIRIIMGSNVGTTFTAWILSMAGIESDNMWIKLLKPENFSLVFALVGIIMIMVCKKQKRRDIGSILVGFAVLMFGMELMGDSVSPLADMPEFTSLLTAFDNPILCVIIGAVFTGVIQSSAASVGILQALALTGSITYSMAIPIIMGQNIGTCVTALLSSIGVSKNAKKVAIVHVTFNLLGTVILLTLFYIAHAIFGFSFINKPIGAFEIAVIHTIFNIASTALLLPFANWLEKIANFVLKDEQAGETMPSHVIDQRLFDTPSIAAAECDNATIRMARLAQQTIIEAMEIIDRYDAQTDADILAKESELDVYEDELGTYLVRLSRAALSGSDSRKVSKMLHSIGDFERLGDHAVNLLKVARELNEKGIHFTEQAKAELKVLNSAITEILALTTRAYETNSIELAAKVEPLEQVIDGLIAAMKGRHIERLREGNCTIELGFILSDLLTNYERVSDHCSNIAVAIIEVLHNSFDTHQYLKSVKYGNSAFDNAFEKYELKYQIK